MSSWRHEHELLPDFLLGLLEPSEARRVERALRRSTELRAEAAALRRALYALPEALEPEPPRPATWEALLTRVRSGADGGADGEADADAVAATAAPGAVEHPPAPSQNRPPVRRARPVLAVALAVALALLAGTAGWGALQQRRASLAAHEEAVVAYWMRSPGLRIIALTPVGAHPAGVVCVLPDGRAMVLQPHAPGAGRSYVVYGVTDGERLELGSTRGRLVEFRADGVSAVEVAVAGPAGGVVARAALP